MTTFTVKESADPKRPGWAVFALTANPPRKIVGREVNDTVWKTKKEADAYCDRLNKLFGEAHE